MGHAGELLLPLRALTDADPYPGFSVGNGHHKTKGKVSGRDGWSWVREMSQTSGLPTFGQMTDSLILITIQNRLGDLVNRFRVKTLGLEPMSTLWAPGQLHRLEVPYTYLWSPGLVPKPPGWGP